LRGWEKFEHLKPRGFDILVLHHAEAIISHDMPEAEQEIESNNKGN